MGHKILADCRPIFTKGRDLEPAKLITGDPGLHYLYIRLPDGDQYEYALPQEELERQLMLGLRKKVIDEIEGHYHLYEALASALLVLQNNRCHLGPSE